MVGNTVAHVRLPNKLYTYTETKTVQQTPKELSMNKHTNNEADALDLDASGHFIRFEAEHKDERSHCAVNVSAQARSSPPTGNPSL